MLSCLSELLAEFTFYGCGATGHHFLAGCKWRTFPSLWQIPWLFVSSLHLQTSKSESILPLPHSLVLSSALFFTFNSSCNKVGSTWIIQGNLPTSKSLTLVTSAKSLWSVFSCLCPLSHASFFYIQGSEDEDMDIFGGGHLYSICCICEDLFGRESCLGSLSEAVGPPCVPSHGESPLSAQHTTALCHWQMTVMDGSG